MNGDQVDLDRAMWIHGRLLEVVEPATPDTIRSSSLRQNLVMCVIAGVGVIGFLMLLYSNLNPDGVGKANPVVSRLSGAILGATFYAFWTARQYLREGTFNSRYSQDYVVRFGLGVVAGFILGDILSEGGTEGAKPASTAQQFGPFTLSVVGGFSAEAVVQILKRIAEVLVTTIRGSDSEQAKADADKRVGKKLNQTAVELQEALQSESPDEVSEKVKEIVGKLLKG